MIDFINIHAIHSLPTGLANRGADGLAKTSIVGGITRQRISPQCFKAHLRANTSITELATALDRPLSIRSALIAEREIAPALVADGATESEALDTAHAVMDALFRGEKDETKKTGKKNGKKPQRKGKQLDAANDAESDTESDNDNETNKNEDEDTITADRSRQILVLGQAEVTAIVCIARTLHAAGIAPTAVRTAIEKPNTKNAEIANTVEALRALRHHAGLDGALFGRMATSSVVSGVDGAVSVSPWQSVHGIQSVTDFFSAQDTLLEPHEMGTAHIGTSEVCCGVFYGSTLIDCARLRSNLGLDDAGVRATIAAVIEAALSTDPSAKRGSTGAPGEMIEAVIEIGDAAPLSAMAAFERPCAAISEAAATVLRDYIHGRQSRLLTRQRPRLILSLGEIITNGGTIDDLVNRTVDAVLPIALAAAAE